MHFGLELTEFSITLKMDINIPLHFIHVPVKSICFLKQGLAMHTHLAFSSEIQLPLLGYHTYLCETTLKTDYKI